MKNISRCPLITLVIVFALCFCNNVNGQEEYEDLLETEGDASDQSELLERLAELRRHPVDLNTASIKEFMRIPWLSPVQAATIVKHRETHGRFGSVSELCSVPGFSGEFVETITPFVSVRVEGRVPSVSGRLRTRISRGASSGEIDGDTFLFREKVYTRGEVTVSDRVTLGFLTEKDADERRLDDHTVYSVAIDRWYLFDTIVVGNYRIGFGQGLTLGDYAGSTKGASFPWSLKKRTRGLRAYTSTAEADPFFGLACTGSVGGLVFSLFGSKAEVDATFNSDGTVSSIYESGLHRTASEQEKKDVLKETMFGADVSYGRESLGSIGATLYHSRYDRAFDPKDVERKQYTFRGKANAVGGLNFDLCYRRLNVFGEAASSGGSGTGMLIGAIFDFDTIEIHALVREYARDFYNLHNCAFAEKPDETQNESGALLGFMYKPNPKTKVRAYVDRLSNPWRRYYEKMPPTRQEFWSQIERKVSQHILATLRLRLKNTETNRMVSEGESKNTRRDQLNVRGQIDWTFSRVGRFRGRCEEVRVSYPDLSIQETGWLLFGELRLVPRKWITLDNRFIIFRTDSYESRIYEFENDLPGLVTNVGFYGEGVRWYILGKVKFKSNVRLCLKYSITRFNESHKEDDHRFGVQFEFKPAL